MSDLPGLIVPIEARIAGLERGLAKANRAQRAASGQMERRAKQSADKINRTYSRMGNGISATLKRAFLPLLATAGFTQMTRNAHKLAEDYRQVENTLKALGQTSDKAAEKLAGAAIRSGSNLGSMGKTVMRIQKATNGEYDETIRRVETLNKLLTVGGATTAEANSVSLQMAQALTSGTLQGDELRSLREAAPVELLDAIAKAAGGTRAELKQLGADGKLTSAVMLTALDSMAASADKNFSGMAMTSERAMQNMSTGMTTFIGRLDEGLGASDKLAQGMADLGGWLNDNADVAEEFGRSWVAAFDTIEDVAGDVMLALEGIAQAINDSALGSVFDLGAASLDTGLTIGEALDQIIDGLATFVGAMAGSADATREAFLKIPDAITGAMQASLNAIITGVEAMINRVLDGVRVVAQAVDDMTSKIPGTDGTNLAGGIAPVKLDRITGLKTTNSNRSVADAYAEGAARGEAHINDAVSSATGYLESIKTRFDENRAKLEAEAAEREAKLSPVKPTDDEASDPATSGGGAGGKSGRGGGGRGALDDFTQAAQSIREKTEALKAEAEALAQATGAQNAHGDAMTFAKTKAELLLAAQRSGIALTPEMIAQIDAMAKAYTRAGVDAEAAADKIQQVQDASRAGAQSVTDVFMGMASGAMSAQEAVGKLILEILKLSLQKRLMESLGGAGDSWLGKIVGVIGGGFASGGYTGDGPKLEPAGIVHKGEFVMSKAATSRIGADTLAGLHSAALRGYSGGGLVGAAKGLNKPSGSRTAGQASAQPTISINAPVTVNASGGTHEQNADLSKKIAKEMEMTMRGTVVSEITRQMRPGNLLNRGR